MLQLLLRPLPINYGVLDQSFAQIENRVLNKCGYVPILGSYIGIARMVVGLIQMIMAIVFLFSISSVVP